MLETPIAKAATLPSALSTTDIVNASGPSLAANPGQQPGDAGGRAVVGGRSFAWPGVECCTNGARLLAQSVQGIQGGQAEVNGVLLRVADLQQNFEGCVEVVLVSIA